MNQEKHFNKSKNLQEYGGYAPYGFSLATTEGLLLGALFGGLATQGGPTMTKTQSLYNGQPPTYYTQGPIVYYPQSPIYYY